MISGFTARKPWAAACVALLLGPFVGMCYLSRGRVAWVYLACQYALLSLTFAAAQLDLLKTSPLDIIHVPIWGIRLAGAVHAFLIAKQHASPERPKWYARWPALTAFVLLPVLLAFSFRLYGFESFSIASRSMYPNLIKGDYLFARKLAYINRHPARGDVVVFTLNGQDHLKRVIGVPGDRVQMKGSLLYLNDVPVPRERIEDFVAKEDGVSRTSPRFTETLPDGRQYGILDETATGPLDDTPVFVVPAEHYFVLGDNRDNSIDSRIEEKMGFVPRDSITGQVVVIFWNLNDWKFRYQPVD